MIRKATTTSLRNRFLPTSHFFIALIKVLSTHSLNELCPLETYPTLLEKVALQGIHSMIVTWPYTPSVIFPKAAISFHELVLLHIMQEH